MIKSKTRFLAVVFTLVWLFLQSGVSSAETLYVTNIEKRDCPHDSIVLVSWNVCNFGRSKSTETISFMAKLLKNADIVALQEVSTSDWGAQAVAKLADELNRTGFKWDYAVSDPTEGPGKERFAFLWKTSRMTVIPRKAFLSTVLRDLIDREPAYIKIRVGEKTVTLVSFHLRPMSKNPLAEVEALGKNPEEFSSDQVILVGDFNLNHKQLFPVFENLLGARHNIEGKTSLKNKSDNGGHLSKEYDNIFTRGVAVCHSAIIDFVPLFENFKKAREISDHLPVFIVFCL